ncbi:MAG: sulfatase-like hydrolase/transferase [Beijerinckiaceae bacterium]
MTQSLTLDTPVSRADRLKHLCLAAALGSFATWIAVWAGGDRAVSTLGSLPILLHGMLFALILPRTAGQVFALVFLLLVTALGFVNDFKIGLTSMPLMWADFRVFGMQPLASLKALLLPAWAHYAIVAGAPAVAAVATGSLIVSLARANGLALRLAAGAVIALNAGLLANQYQHAIDRHLASLGGGSWSPESLVYLSKKVGITGFLAYSRWLDSKSTGLYFDASSAAPPDAAAVDAAARNLVVPPAAGFAPLPNIVAVLAESTFDPNEAFRLTKPVDDYLLHPNPLTHARGTVFVTPIGGGTWMSEFELFTGLNARLFGFHGLYTHTMLAPHVRRTLLTGLREKGYATAAYYATDSTFFNTRAAFHHYGFEKDFDGPDLGFSGKDWHVKDTEIAERVIRASARDDATKPFFKFVQLLENHAPHPCPPGKRPQDLKTQLAGNAGFAMDCQLDAYIGRMHSTSAAIKALQAWLGESEKRTGRPYLLVVFGDHQPHTFTGTDSAMYDFKPYRKDADPRFATFHIMGTAKNRLRIDPASVIPLTLLPTLISAYTATAEKDLFLPVNAWALKRCGYDIAGSRNTAMSSDTGKAAALLAGRKSKNCADLDSVVAAYKAAGLLDLR